MIINKFLEKLKTTIISSFIALGFWSNSVLANNVKDVDGKYIIEVIFPKSDRVSENRIAPLKAKSALLKKLKANFQIKSIQLYQFTLVKKEYLTDKVKFTFQVDKKNVQFNMK